MRIRINQIDFDITAVPAPMRSALLTDPLIAQAVLRDAWEWDAVTQKGAVLAPATKNGTAILPNGISFFVPRSRPDGTIEKAEAPSAKMAERLLQATGAKSLRDVIGALNQIVELPQKSLPLDIFRPLNATLSYKLRMFTDFAVVQMQNAGRNLTAYLFLPAQVGFMAEVTAIPDEAAHKAAGVDAAALRPGFIIPARTEAAQGMRRVALAQQINELKVEIESAGGNETATPEQRQRATRLSAEWQVLAPPKKAG